ncbi:MAG TPA: hypothetical protein V6C72_00430 [Chroococcales cyanobacterium]
MENRNSNRKLAGAAINGLRPYIKALELAAGITKSANDYRYVISEDRQTAKIICNPAPGSDKPHDQWVEVAGTEKSLSDWAALGKRVRHAFIGLKSVKDDLRLDGVYVQFTLNVLTNEAFLAQNGERLADRPQTIDEWARLGRPIEKAQFESLNAAIDYNLEDAAKEVRAKMVRLGIFREKKSA